MPAPISFTPAIQACLNTNVINRFNAGWALGTQRISGLLDICGPRTSDSENLAVLIAGKNFNLYRRNRNAQDVRKRKPNAYEQRAKLGNYADFLTIDRMDAIYDKWDQIMLIAETGGAEAAEGPTRMVEVLVPVAMTITSHTGVPFWSASHPVKPGSATTFANVEDLGALDFDTFDEAKQKLKQIPDEDGHAGNANATVLAFGPAYEEMAYEIVKNRQPKDYAGGVNLRAERGILPICVPDWDDDIWGVFDTSMDADMPFYFVEGRKLAVKPLYTDPNGAWEIYNNELVYAVDGDMAAAIGNPRKAFLAAAPGDAAAIAAKYAARYELNDFDFTLT